LRFVGPVEFGVLESDIYYTSGAGYVSVGFRDSIDDSLTVYTILVLLPLRLTVPSFLSPFN
jgi:hypothetical protein